MDRGNLSPENAARKLREGTIGNLNNQLRMFDLGMLPTPTTADYKGGQARGSTDGSRKSKFGIRLDTKIEGQVGTKTGLRLQPAFVEWMMGFPPGWTDLG